MLTAMMNNVHQKFFLVLLILIGSTAFSQSISFGIKGKVVDADSRAPLTDATVTVLAKEDSSAVGFSIADKTGAFEIKNMKAGSYILGITFTGYKSLFRNVDLNASRPYIDLDTLRIASGYGTLENITITQAPILINKDTIEFKAGAFKTKPNGTVEDLLKNLPGVEVDKDGNITAQGEDITKVYVDGKEFFSNDPKLATKNLTAELVESVQVFDDMSDQAKFTKIDDGSRQKAINIKLKKDKKKGIFGRSNAGIGSSDRYEASASMNMFRDKTQVSVLGGDNNINRLGFTSNDIISNMGGMGGLQAGGRGGGGGGGRNGGGGNRGGGGFNMNSGGATSNDGNTKSWSGGINYRDQWSPKMEFAGNYFASGTDKVNQTNSYRTNFFTNDSSSKTAEEQYTRNKNSNQRFGFRWQYEIDSMNSLLITPSVSFQHSESLSFDTISTTAINPKFSYNAIDGNSQRSSERDGWTFSNNALYRHRFNKAGRTITVGWTNSLNDSKGDGNNTSPYYYYNTDGTLNHIRNQQQENDQTTHSNNNTISTSFTEMFGTNKILELNYAYTDNKSTSDRNTYDYNNLTTKYDIINKPQTNYFENTFISNRLGTNFRVRQTNYDYQLGGAVQFAYLHNLSNRATTGKDSLMSQRYTNFFPNMSFNYNLGTRKAIRFNYRGSTQAPNVSQLQDVLDVSNPLVYRTGNPNLKQQFNNTLNLSYNTFDLKTFMFLTMNLTGGLTSNKIVNSIDTVNKTTQLIRPENVSGAYNVAFNSTIGIPLVKVTTGKRSPMNLNLTTTIRHSRDVSLLYKETNYSYTNSIAERIRFNYNIQDKLDIGTHFRATYNDARYSVQSTLNNKYFNYNYSLDGNYIFLKRFMLNSSFDYTVNTGMTDGYNQSVPLWNGSLSYLLFKKKNGELKFSVMDILNQNKSIDRNIGDNYIEDTYTQVLKRFYMVSFMFNFNQFGGKNPNARNRTFDRNSGDGGGGFRGNGGGRRNGGGF
jgi:hypothetical protein